MNEKMKNFFDKYSSGIGFTASFLFFFFIFPWIFVQYFKQGLENTSLYTVIACLPFIFASYFVLKTSMNNRIIIRKITGIIQIPLLFILGLIIKFGIDERNISSLVLIDATLICGFYSMILDIQILSFLSQQHKDLGSKKNELNNIIAGIAFIIGINIPLWIIFPGFENVVFSVATLHTIRQIIFTIQHKNDPEPANPNNSEAYFKKKDEIKLNILVMLKFSGVLSIWILSLVFIMYATAEFEVDTYSWPFLGVFLGMIIDRYGISRISKNRSQKSVNVVRFSIIYLGIIMMFLFFIFNFEFMMKPFGLVLNGLFFGLTTDLLIKYYFDAKHLYRNTFSRAIEAILLVILLIGFGLLAHEMKFIILDHTEIWWILPIIATFISIFSVLLIISSQNGLQKMMDRSYDAIKLRNEYIIINNIKSKKITAIALIVLVCSSLATILLYTKAGAYVHISLDETMYTVNGEAITEVNLNERSGIILLKSPNPTGIVHNEAIRLGKSVRLGAYLYDTRAIGNLTMEEAIEWLGYNLDVFSLGGYTNNTVWPDDILTIKSINPRNRFYIMNFATTQGENDNWTVDGDRASYTSWNDTMDSWTVKTKEGTEALGVRHTSEDCSGHLMDLGNMEWADYYAWIWDNRVKNYHANGVAIDEVMWKGYWNTDITNLRDYNSIEEITQTCYEWLERVDSKMDTEIITQAFWKEAQEYQQGIWGELAFRCGGAYGNRVDDRTASVFYEEMNWEEIVNNMYLHSSKNRSYIWAAWYERNDMEALEYAISTYLMGKANENTSLVFHPQPVYDGGYPYNLAGYSLDTVRQEIENHPEYFDLELGDALGPMELVNSNGNQVWKREFTNGIVYVNPFHAYVPGFDTPAEFNPSH